MKVHQITLSTHEGSEALIARHGEMVDAVAVGDLLAGGNVAFRDEYHLLRKKLNIIRFYDNLDPDF